MTKLKPYWTTSQNLQQIWSLSTRKGLSKRDRGWGEEKEIFNASKFKQTNKRQRHFALSLGSKLTQLCLPCNPQASRYSEVACLGLSLLPGEAKESVLHSAATSFTLSSWGLEYRHLDWEFLIFPNPHSRCTTLPPVTGCYEQHPSTTCNPTHFSLKKVPRKST